MKPCYIAWVGYTSIGIGTNIDRLLQSAQATISAPRWQAYTPGPAEVRITTYGTQRLISTHTIRPAEEDAR